MKVIGMKIIQDFEDSYYPKKSRILGNCYTVLLGEHAYHYEFILKDKEATIKTDSLECIEDVIEVFRRENRYISLFRTTDSTFYKSYDETMTFKLPVSILQVSEFFLNSTHLDLLKSALDYDQLYVPVAIIEDEYVLLGRHHEVYLAQTEGIKMVEVYLDNLKENTIDYIYIAKEQNIRHIEDMKLLEETEYTAISEQFKNLF